MTEHEESECLEIKAAWFPLGVDTGNYMKGSFVLVPQNYSFILSPYLFDHKLQGHSESLPMPSYKTELVQTSNLSRDDIIIA